MTPKFLGGEVARRRGQGPPRRPGEVARLAGEPLVRHRRSPTASGPTSWASASSSRSTTSGSATPPRTPSCSRRWASGSPTRSTTSRRWSATSATRGRTSARPQRNESNASDERNFAHANLRRIKAENLLDTISAVTDTKDKFQGLPARRPRRADRRRRQLDLLPDHLRPRHPRDGLLVRGQDGADPLAGPPPAQRRHGQRQDPAGRRDPQADRPPRSSPRSGSSSSTSAASPASRPRRSSTSSCPTSARGRTRPRPSKTSSGPCSTAANSCSIIDRRWRSRMAESDVDRRSPASRTVPAIDATRRSPTPESPRPCDPKLDRRDPLGLVLCARRRRPSAAAADAKAKAEGHLPGPRRRRSSRTGATRCHNADKQKGGLNLETYGARHAGRRLGQGHRAGRRRTASTLFGSSRTRKSPRCRPTRPRSPTPRST